MEEKRIYLASGDILIRTTEGNYYRLNEGHETPILLDHEEGEWLALETAEMLATALETLAETNMVNANFVVKYEGALREIDTHIRSTPAPVPHIINTLKQTLEDYED